MVGDRVFRCHGIVGAATAAQPVRVVIEIGSAYHHGVVLRPIRPIGHVADEVTDR